MEPPFSGGCVCGAVRFRCDSEPLAMYNCHCRGCQRASGAPFVPVLVLPSEALSVTGKVKTFVQRNPEDQQPQRCYCPSCGAALFASSETIPGIVLVNALALDDPSWFCPIADIWTISAQPWTHWDTRIPKVYKAPPLLENACPDEMRASS